MIGTALLTATATIAATEAFKNLAKSIHSAAETELKDRLRAWRNKTAIQNFYKHLHKVRQVKTLGQLEKAVDISKFYCASHVYLGKQRVLVNQCSDLPHGRNLLIEGIAGQGKSIFLRFLTAIELARGEFIPIFLELRRLKDRSLEEFVFLGMKELGLDMTQSAFAALCKTGKVILFLDAFDEVDPDEKSRVVNELEHLMACQESLRVIVTSRPDNELHVSPLFDVVTLSDLENSEYETVINKLLDNAETGTALIRQVQSHHGGVFGLLKTPLLVTLLVINYKAYQQIPAQLPEFYDSLFLLLLQRHDGSKAGYVRKRLCSLNDNEYRRGFEALCFQAKRVKKLDHESIYATAKQCLESLGFEVDAQKFLTDIVKITCLLVRDGEEYRFIHKSVQEYYTASFLRSKPEKTAVNFYQKLFESDVSDYSSELMFLSTIDAYRFSKYGLIPAAARYFQVTPDQLMDMSVEEAAEVLVEKLSVGSLHLWKDHRSSFALYENIPSLIHEGIRAGDSIDCNELIKACAANEIPAHETEKGVYIVQVMDMIERGIQTDKIREGCREAAEVILARIRTALTLVSEAEKQDILEMI